MDQNNKLLRFLSKTVLSKITWDFLHFIILRQYLMNWDMFTTSDEGAIIHWLKNNTTFTGGKTHSFAGYSLLCGFIISRLYNLLIIRILCIIVNP